MSKRKHVNSTYIIAHVIMILFSVACIIPFLLLVSASFSDEKSLVINGYSLWPSVFSTKAYEYLFLQSNKIMHAYGITVLITIIGTVAGILLTTMFAYPLSRPDLPHRRFFSFLLFFTMLFSGGLAPTYMFYTQYLHIKNTLFALIVPGLLMNAFNVIIVRTYYQGNIPIELIDAAKIDGATEFQIYRKVVVPISKPIMLTVGLLIGMAYWNDWFNGITYITDSNLYSIQNFLYRVMQQIQFLTNSDNLGSFDMSSIPTTAARMAIAVIGVAPILIIFPFLSKYFAKGLTIGSVKG